MIEWPKFVEALKTVVPVDEETEKQLLYILGIFQFSLSYK